MATAARKSLAAVQLARRARTVRVPPSIGFVISEDDHGAHHRNLVAGVGATLAQCASFASYDDAGQPSRCVLDGAAPGRFDRRAGGVRPVDLAARRDRTGDDLDTERRLEEGGQLQQRGGGEIASATLITPSERLMASD